MNRLNKPFLKGVDPRTYVPNYRPRGEKRYYYTVSDIATVLNRSTQTIKNLISAGKLDPTDLKSIINNYTKRYVLP